MTAPFQLTGADHSYCVLGCDRTFLLKFRSILILVLHSRPWYKTGGLAFGLGLVVQKCRGLAIRAIPIMLITSDDSIQLTGATHSYCVRGYDGAIILKFGSILILVLHS